MSALQLPLTRLTLILPLRERPQGRTTEVRRKEVEFMTLYGPVIEHWCRKWGLRETVAEELADGIVAKVLRRLETYDPSRKFRPWLKTVARYAVIDYFREPAIVVGGTRLQDWLGSIASPDALNDLGDDLISVTDDRFDHLGKAVEIVRGRVEAHTWDAFYEAQVLGTPAKDVARMLDVEPWVVHNAGCKVRKMLREEIGRLEDEDRGRTETNRELPI